MEHAHQEVDPPGPTSGELSPAVGSPSLRGPALSGCCMAAFSRAASGGYVGMPVPPAALFCTHTSCAPPSGTPCPMCFSPAPWLPGSGVGYGSLWEAVTGATFPVSAAVLLADDRRVVAPTAGC